MKNYYFEVTVGSVVNTLVTAAFNKKTALYRLFVQLSEKEQLDFSKIEFVNEAPTSFPLEETVDDWVDEWHTNKLNLGIIYEFFGWTEEEYQEFVISGKVPIKAH